MTSFQEKNGVGKGSWYGFTWHAEDYSDGQVQHNTFLIKFKTEQIANEFKQAIQDIETNKITHIVKGFNFLFISLQKSTYNLTTI